MKVSFERVKATKQNIIKDNLCDLCCFTECKCFSNPFAGIKGITSILPCSVGKNEYYWIKVKNKRSKL